MKLHKFTNFSIINSLCRGWGEEKAGRKRKASSFLAHSAGAFLPEHLIKLIFGGVFFQVETLHANVRLLHLAVA